MSSSLGRSLALAGLGISSQQVLEPSKRDRGCLNSWLQVADARNGDGTRKLKAPTPQAAVAQLRHCQTSKRASHLSSRVHPRRPPSLFLGSVVSRPVSSRFGRCRQLESDAGLNVCAAAVSDEGGFVPRTSSNGNGSSKYMPLERSVGGSSKGVARIPYPTAQDDSFLEAKLLEMEKEAEKWEKEYGEMRAQIMAGAPDDFDAAWEKMSEAERLQFEEETAEFRSDLKELYMEVTRLHDSGNMAEAQALIEANLAELQQQVDQGVGGVEQAVILQVLAQLQFVMGELKEVEPLLSKTSSLLEKIEETEPMLEEVLENMGDLYNGLEKPGEAMDFFRRSIELKEKAAGKDSLELVEPLVNLAHTHMALDESVQAVQLYRRAVAITEARFGAQSPELAVPLSFLGHALLQIEQTEEGEEVLERVLRIVEMEDGLLKESTAMAVCSVGRAKASNGDYEAAVEYFKKGLSILEEVGVAKEDLNMEAVRLDLADVYVLMDKDAEAQEIWEQNLQIRESVSGPDDPQLLPHLQNLANSYAIFEEFEKVEPLLKRCVDIFRRTAGPDAPQIALPLQHYAATLYHLDKFEEAEAASREVLQLKEKAFGPEGTGIKDACNQLAATLHSQGKNEEAEVLLRRGLGLVEADPDSASEEVLEMVQALETVLTALGKHEEARPLVARANRLKRRLLTESEAF